MSWLDMQTSFYKCNADNIGRPATFREILLSDFAIDHEWFYKVHKTEQWVTGQSNDLQTIIELRKLDKNCKDYTSKKTILKQTLQCFTPAALLETKKKGMVKEISRSGIMQLDFDHSDISCYDIEELKQAVFSLPFVGFCGLSCSGDGFYALALIAEPEKLADYAEHCFEVLDGYRIKADRSKGKKVENLRYVSYDSKMLIRENPEPLKVFQFKRKESAFKAYVNTSNTNVSKPSYLVTSELAKLKNAHKGQRWATVQQVAYTLGGLNDSSVLNMISEAIVSNNEFAGEEAKYMRCAEYCFKQGAFKPLVAIVS